MRSGWLMGGVLVSTLVLAACQGGVTGTSPGATSAPAGFTNPVYPANFPDPMVIATPDGFLAVATNGNGANVQTLLSPDLVTWQQGDDALPVLPDWSQPGKVWAPEVVKHSDGRFLLYYTTIAPDPAIQCVSVAVASVVTGPYVDDSSEPLVCEKDQGGSIDASPFTAADGTRFLYWKNDGNAVGVDTYLSVAELSEDGTSLAGTPTRLFKQDLDWEGDLVEAPFVWEDRGRFHLFYSANSYASADYAVGHAVADSPTGPFTKDPEPVLVTDAVAEGPGHCSLIMKDDRVWMVYHAWTPGEIGSDVPGRSMWLSEVTFAEDGSVSVVAPAVDYPTSP